MEKKRLKKKKKKRLKNLVYVDCQSNSVPMLQMGIQPEGERKHNMGESVFPETDPISLFFRFAYILLVIHSDEYRVTRGQQTRPLSQSGASYKIIQRS